MPSTSNDEAASTDGAGAPEAGTQGTTLEDGTGRASSPPGSEADGSETGGAPEAGNGQVAGEPGFETGTGGDVLPDMRDTPTLDPGTLAALEAAMEAAAASGNGAGNERGEDSGSTPGSTSGQWPADTAGAGDTSTTAGPLTPAEQVAILDARLEAGTGEFDTMILEEQARQRSARRASSNDASTDAASEDAASGAAPGGLEGPYGEEITVAGAGGGQGSVNTPGRSGPVNPARYPPPDDIPNGNDDDVVARQLREAAMREPDPAVREKLWEEYRKYKGITP